jgi:hypothetical protein
MRFIATEAGFRDGMGGASNAQDENEYHYILFGRQVDDQHPDNTGAYFEYDDQKFGSVNCVERIVIGDKLVEFTLWNGEEIVVWSNTSELQWHELIKGIYSVFDTDKVQCA